MALRRRRNESSEEENEKKVKFSKDGFKRLFGILKYMKPYLGIFILGLFFLVVSSVVFMAFPQLFGEMLDSVMKGAFNGDGPDTTFVKSDPVVIFWVLLGLFGTQAVFSFLRVLCFAHVSQHSMADVRADIYRRLITLPMAFFDKRRVGELTSRIMADVTQLQGLLSTTMAELLRQVVVLGAGLSILFMISAKLTGFMLAVVPVVMAIAAVLGRSIRKLSRKTQDDLAESNVVVEETLQSVNMVKAYTNEIFEIKRYRSTLTTMVKQAIRTARFRGIFISFLIFGIFVSISLVLLRGSQMIGVPPEEGGITAGQLVSFFIYTIFIGGSVGGLGDLLSQVQKGLGGADRVMDILEEKTEGDPDATPTGLPALQGNIEYKDVRFSYPTREDMEVLKGINLTIRSGEKVALAGSSGAGKSTIVQLLLKLYDLSSGELLVDGKPIQEYDIYHLRSHIGIVPQEVLLFGGTIRENIAYGHPDATDEDIKAAARKANALEFIESFPEGLETIVGDRGVKLSGGQRQRIAIARAILKDPAVLLLDEATSSLDAESEALVQDALDKLMEGRTAIIIAHRLATIRKVDRIYVLQEGQVVEMGNHEELAKKENGVYANLVELQNLVQA